MRTGAVFVLLTALATVCLARSSYTSRENRLSESDLPRPQSVVEPLSETSVSEDGTSDVLRLVLNEATRMIQRAAPPAGYRRDTQKRNSEIINSILGLPKVMQKAGR